MSNSDNYLAMTETKYIKRLTVQCFANLLPQPHDVRPSFFPLLLCNGLKGNNTNQYKKLIYSERFWQANSRRINDIMVIPL